MKIGKSTQSTKLAQSYQSSNQSFSSFDYNPNVFTNKSNFVHKMVSEIRANGGMEFWVMNRTYFEIYHFKATQITDFDVVIDLDNSLAEEHILSVTFVLHMKNKILELLEEVPGKVYLNKFECYKDLYKSLHEKFRRIKSKSIKAEIFEKIEYVEDQFPELLL